MARADHPATGRHRNPFSWRLAELAAIGHDPNRTARRRELVGELAIAEANEVVHGLRHLAIAHGATETQMAVEQVETFVRNVGTLVPVGFWTRRAGPDHLIVAVAGDDADDRIDQLAAIAELCNPGHWRISSGARPDLDPPG